MCDSGRWGCGEDLHAYLLHKQQIPHCMLFLLPKDSVTGFFQFFRFFYVSNFLLPLYQFFIVFLHLGFAAFFCLSLFKISINHSLSLSRKNCFLVSTISFIWKFVGFRVSFTPFPKVTSDSDFLVLAQDKKTNMFL